MLYNLKFLRDLRTFGGQEGSKGGAEKDSGSKSTADSTSFKGTPKPTIGAVSSTGDYAGDGFEWVSQGTNENGSQMLTRTYTGANSGAGLGQAVISGGTSDKDVKTAIGQISLNEGSSYASTPSSATDGDALQYLKTAFAPDTPASSGRSGSFAEQMGNVNYAQTTPGSSGSFNDAFAAARQDQGAGGVFNYDGNQFTTDYAPKSTGIMSSLRPQQRPVVASEPIVSADYGGESSGDFLSRRARDRDLNPGDTNIGDGVQVAGGSFLDYILGPNYPTDDPRYDPPFLGDPTDVRDGPIGAKDVVSYDAFGNEYATAEEAAEADIDMNNASVLANNPDFRSQFPGDVPEGYLSSSADINMFPPAEPISALDLGKSALIGIPSNTAGMFGGLADFVGSRATEGTGNLLLDGAQEFYSRVINPDASQEAILSADPAISEGRSTALGARAAESGLNTVADYLTSKFFPDGRNEAVITGTTPGELGITDVSGTGGGAGVANVTAEEIGGGVVDVALSANPATRITSGILNIGEQISGTEATSRAALTQLVKSGALADNAEYNRILGLQGGNVENAITAITRANVNATAPQTAGTGVFDAMVPKFARGLGGMAKDIAVRANIEGGQEVAEQAIALSGLNNILGLTDENKQQIFQDASGNYIMGALAGGGTSVVAAPVVTGIQTLGQQLRGPDQVISRTEPPLLAKPVLDPTLGERSGELADSTVQSSFDLAENSGSKALDPNAARDAEIFAAEELLISQMEQNPALMQSAAVGNVSEITALAARTGLPMDSAVIAAENAISRAMETNADNLQLIAEQEAIDNNGTISPQLVSEIQTMLTPELAAEVLMDASNAPYTDARGRSRMDIFLDGQQPGRLPAQTVGTPPNLSGIELAPMRPEFTPQQLQAAEVLLNDQLNSKERAKDAAEQTRSDLSEAKNEVNMGIQPNIESSLAAIRARRGDPVPDSVQPLAPVAPVIEKDPSIKTKPAAPLVEEDVAATVEVPVEVPAVTEQAVMDFSTPEIDQNAMYRYRSKFGGKDSLGTPVPYSEVIANETITARESVEVTEAQDAVFDNKKRNETNSEVIARATKVGDAVAARVMKENIAKNYVAVAPETDVAATVEVDAPIAENSGDKVDTGTSLSTIPTRVVVGDSLEGYSAADVLGQPIGSSTPIDDLDLRRTNPGQFTNMKDEPIGSIDNAPYGEPVRRVIDNPDGTTTIQVGSRVSAEGAAGNRDNYVSAAATLPSSATDEQKAAAYKEALANWKSNYEGATTSGEIERNAGKVVPNEDVAKGPDQIVKELNSLGGVAAEVEIADPTLEEFRTRAQTDIAKYKTVNNIVLGIEKAIREKVGDAAADTYLAEAEAQMAANMDARIAAEVEIADPTAVVENSGRNLGPFGAVVEVPLSAEDLAKSTEIDAALDQAVGSVVENSGRNLGPFGAVVEVPLTAEEQVYAAGIDDALDQAVDSTTEVLVDSSPVELSPGSESETVVELNQEPKRPTVASDTGIKVLTEVGEFPEVVDDEVVDDDDDDDDDGGVTVTLPSGDSSDVAPIAGVNEDGDPTIECPEGYMMVDGPDGPTCQEVEGEEESSDSYRLRAGAGTQAYTGQTIKPGERGPGQRRKKINS